MDFHHSAAYLPYADEGSFEKSGVSGQKSFTIIATDGDAPTGYFLPPLQRRTPKMQ